MFWVVATPGNHPKHCSCEFTGVTIALISDRNISPISNMIYVILFHPKIFYIYIKNFFTIIAAVVVVNTL